MRFKPQCTGRDDRINPGVPPPRGLITEVMQLTMVSPTIESMHFAMVGIEFADCRSTRRLVCAFGKTGKPSKNRR